MALTNEQLADIKAKMESGRPMPTIENEDYPDEKFPAVRKQMVETYGIHVFRQIARLQLAPLQFVNRLERMAIEGLSRFLNSEHVTVERIDRCMAAMQNALVKLQQKKDSFSD